VYSTIYIHSVHVSHPAVISPSHPQMVLVSVSGKVNFFRDYRPNRHLLNLLSYTCYFTQGSSPT